MLRDVEMQTAKQKFSDADTGVTDRPTVSERQLLNLEKQKPRLIFCPVVLQSWSWRSLNMEQYECKLRRAHEVGHQGAADKLIKRLIFIIWSVIFSSWTQHSRYQCTTESLHTNISQPSTQVLHGVVFTRFTPPNTKNNKNKPQ